MSPESFWSINLGHVLTIVAFIGGIWGASIRLTQRLTHFEGVIAEHARIQAEHSKKLEHQDRSILDLVGNVQRLVGRLEILGERRREPRG